MKTLFHKPTNTTYQETDTFGYWPDRSPMTAWEASQQSPNDWEIGVSESVKFEVFDLAKSLLLAFAQGGVNAPAEDCINKAKEMINLRGKI